MAGVKLNDKEIKERTKKAYQLRYEDNFTQLGYVKWAKEEYGDKSEQQYCQYFLKAKEYYDEVWKDRLYKQLGPAVDQLIGNLADDNPKVRDLAIAKVFKYTGHDIDRKEINATVTEIKVGFSSDE
tara:strand:+ start:1326 stop:1703 length:378 start_codon:yes stop_codon:yes gene_type:complete